MSKISKVILLSGIVLIGTNIVTMRSVDACSSIDGLDMNALIKERIPVLVSAYGTYGSTYIANTYGEGYIAGVQHAYYLSDKETPKMYEIKTRLCTPFYKGDEYQRGFLYGFQDAAQEIKR